MRWRYEADNQSPEATKVSGIAGAQSGATLAHGRSRIMRMEIFRKAILFTALAGTGCGDEAERISSRTEGIVAGEPAPDDHAVVALTHGGEMFCTGTVISPRVVLTAAHCLHPDVLPIDMTKIEVFFGPALDPAGTFLAVVEVMPHPDYDPHGAYDLDVGLVRLAADAPAPPAFLPIRPFTSDYNGKPVRLVGYGITGIGERNQGTKRQTEATIVAYGQNQFTMLYSPGGVCHGDSGGAAYLIEDGREVVAGVHSQGDCTSVFWDERVDVYLESFIEPFIHTDVPEPCASDGECETECATPDPDCGEVGVERPPSAPQRQNAEGCGMGNSSPGAHAGWALWIAFAIGFVRRRRDEGSCGDEPSIPGRSRDQP